MLLDILIILLILSLFGGGWGYSRYGYWAAGPFGLILVVLLFLWLFGQLGV